jgi:drug/metabolite transporter (DMT)-like permease
VLLEDDRAHPPNLPAREHGPVVDADGRTSRARLLTTAHGTHGGAYTAEDWGLMVSVALMWGSANFLIAEALDDLEPGLVTLLRVGIGFLTLAAMRRARHVHIEREDWPRVAVVGVTWIALPFTLFPIAQQWIDSSLAGILIGALPLFTAALASVLLRRRPNRMQTTGLAIGLVGVVLVGVPALGEEESTALGVVLVLLAVMSYAVAVNVSVPLQQRYGSVPLMTRALGIATVLVIPYGLAGIGSSELGGQSLLSVVILGVFPSGLAFLAFTTLTGRVGATRGAVANYFVPVVALVLGAAIRDEHVEALSIVGAALVIAGAVVVTRSREVVPTRA